MPIYEYSCKTCDAEFEALVSGSDKPECPECGDVRLERRFSAFAVRSKTSVAAGIGPCGSCGDPRGPGACGLH